MSPRSLCRWGFSTQVPGKEDGMAPTVSKAGRYACLARLIVAHGPGLVSGPGAGDMVPGAGDVVPDADDERDAVRLAKDLEAMGPTFVKLGQLMSTRSDLLSPAHLRALCRLQDDVEAFPAEEAAEVFEKELGVSVKDAFSSFEPTPIASASLGQVYRAKLRDGRRVVVKVQRPGIEDQVAADVAALEELAKLIDTHTDAGRRYGFRDLLDQFRRSLLEELDYEREASNQLRLGAILQDHPSIVVPRPVEDFTSRRVLTMDDIRGRKVTDVSPLALMELDGPALAEAVFVAYLDQIFVAGFFHADPHPGNVLVTTDGRIGLIDLGMVGHVRPELRTELVKLLLAVDEGRGEEAGRILCDLGTRLDDFDKARMLREVAALVDRTQGLSVGQAQVGRMMTDLSRMCGACGLRPPPELSMLARTLLNLDAVAKALAPDFDPSVCIRQNSERLVGAQMKTSTGGIFSALVDARDFAEALPGRAGRILDALAAGELQVKVRAFDEVEMLRHIQKLANRVTLGLVIAALVLGASIMSRSYPTVALVCFIAAACAGLVLVVSILLSDRNVTSVTRRRRR